MMETWGTARWFPPASASQHQKVREKLFEAGENRYRWSQSLEIPLCTALLCLTLTGCLSWPSLLNPYLSASLCTPHLLLHLLLFNPFSLPANFLSPSQTLIVVGWTQNFLYACVLIPPGAPDAFLLPGASQKHTVWHLLGLQTWSIVSQVLAMVHTCNNLMAQVDLENLQGRSAHHSNHLHHSADMESSAPDTSHLLEFSSPDRQG